jgi:hypothetical protein
MKNMNKSTGDSWPHKVSRSLVLSFVVMMMVMSGTAHADDGRGRGRYDDRNWRGHEVGARRYWNRPGFIGEPGVIYAPPVVYSPPVYQEPGFNLIIPLRIR